MVSFPETMLCKFSDINLHMFCHRILQTIVSASLLCMNGLFVCNTLNHIYWLFQMQVSSNAVSVFSHILILGIFGRR